MDGTLFQLRLRLPRNEPAWLAREIRSTLPNDMNFVFLRLLTAAERSYDLRFLTFTLPSVEFADARSQ